MSALQELQDSDLIIVVCFDTCFPQSIVFGGFCQVLNRKRGGEGGGGERYCAY